MQGEHAACDASYFASLVQKAKPYSISLYKYQMDALVKAGGVHQHNGIWMLDTRYYDGNGIGLTTEALPQEFLEVN